MWEPASVAGANAPAFVERNSRATTCYKWRALPGVSPGLTPRPSLSGDGALVTSPSGRLLSRVAGANAPAFVERVHHHSEFT